MAFETDQKVLSATDFKRLYEAHLTAVFNFCLYRVGDYALAEDITADSFERAWRNRRAFDPEKATFTTWLFAIARNRIADGQRWQGRRSLVELNGDQRDDGLLPEETAARSEKVQQLHEFVRDLTAEQQELIALKFGAGLTNRAIAELLDKSETAVGSALHRALGKIRRQLSEAEISI